MRSRASLTSGTRRSRCARSRLLLGRWLLVGPVDTARGRAAPGIRPTGRAGPGTPRTGGAHCASRAGAGPCRRCPRSARARRRSTPAPKGTSTSRRSGRWRVRTARVSTLTMRTSPFSLATAGSSTPRTRTSGTSPETVERLTPGLAERRQDLLDVAQEQRVRPDHEHALALQREAVRVEQVGGAVQRHCRLPRAGPALDDEDTGQRRADDLVLLALDGADDVAHLAGPRLAQGGQQRARAAQDQALGQQALAAVADLRAAGTGRAPRRRRVPPGRRSTRPRARARPVPARRGGGGGPAPGGRGPWPGRRARPPGRASRRPAARGPGPTRPAGRCGRTHPAAGCPTSNLHPRLGQAVDPPEVERLVADVELLQAGQARAHHDVALGARLERAAPAEVEDALQHLPRLAPHELQSVVGTVEELLLILQIGMFGHLSPSSPGPRGNGSV